MTATRRLAAILAADVAGYSRLVGRDEEGTLARLRDLRQELIDPQVATHHGRIVKTTGDGILIEFSSVVDAARCAIVVQQGMAQQNAEVPPERQIAFRVGINLGDIVAEGDDILGDGVNIAARLEGIAEPGGIYLSGPAYDQVRDRLDCGFDDLGEQQVKNIARPVRVFAVRLGDAQARTPPALPLPDKPSIAVLPFQNLSGDPEQEYFVDGMVEEIITALSRIRWLFVIARNSSFIFKGRAVDVKQVGRELGVRYVLEGSVRKAGPRVRITGQLIDTETGAHLWADHFDGSLEDVFELQDQVAISVAGVIEPTLQGAEARRSAERPTGDLTAYDLYLRALQNFSSMAQQEITAAVDLLDQAIARDPGYGGALALAALCRTQMHLSGWTADAVAARAEGLDYARRAIRATDSDPFVLGGSAFVFGYFGEDIEAAMALVDRALAANPGSGYGWLWSGLLRLIAGHPDTAIEHLERSLRLSPHERFTAPLSAIGCAYFFKREFDTAAAKLQASLQERPGFAMTYRILAACYAHMGRLDAARQILERLRGLTPVAVPPGLPLRNREHRELFFSGLRLAAGDTD